MRALWWSFRYCRVPGRAEGLAGVAAAARLCVVPMTFYSVTIGALAGYVATGGFDWPVYLAVLAGFTLAHLADNLLNDYSDYKGGVDAPGYFRALYGPHPILDGVVAARSALLFVASVLAVDAALAAWLALERSPLIAPLAALGVASMALYAGFPVDAKRLGFGEALVAVVWGPVMAGGTLLAVTGGLHPRWAVAAYLPYAATVSLVLIGKHLDKLPQDSARGVGTLPVRLGEERARRLAAAIALAAPLAASMGLYAALQAPHALLPLASAATAAAAARILASPRPPGPPEGWRAWPLWYAGAAYAAMDSLGRSTVAALLALGLAAHGHPHYALAAVAAALAAEAAVAPRLHRLASRARRALMRG